jgi:hypothetical protein
MLYNRMKYIQYDFKTYSCVAIYESEKHVTFTSRETHVGVESS